MSSARLLVVVFDSTGVVSCDKSVLVYVALNNRQDSSVTEVDGDGFDNRDSILGIVWIRGAVCPSMKRTDGDPGH